MSTKINDKIAFGAWNGGIFMKYGLAIKPQRYVELVHRAYEGGCRVFVSSDVYGMGKCDELLGEALRGKARDSYKIFAAIGHDFYKGKRAGAGGFQRFTDANLRPPRLFLDYLEMACEKSLTRLDVGHFDCVMLHNPDRIGYHSEAVWSAMHILQTTGVTRTLGVAPGPANGFAIDLCACFEKFGSLIDRAMLILNPFEPWPAKWVLPAAESAGVKVVARVVDHGGIFHDCLTPNSILLEGDHRLYRPDFWLKEACAKLEKLRPFAEKKGISILHLASLWTLAQKSCDMVVPSLVQEREDELNKKSKSIEDQLEDLLALPRDVELTASDLAKIERIGDNVGCMALKGASSRNNDKEETADSWGIDEELVTLADKYAIDPAW